MYKFEHRQMPTITNTNTDGQTDVQTDIQTLDGQETGWKYRKLDRQLDRYTKKQKDQDIKSQTCGHTNGLKDGQKCRWIDN